MKIGWRRHNGKAVLVWNFYDLFLKWFVTTCITAIFCNCSAILSVWLLGYMSYWYLHEFINYNWTRIVFLQLCRHKLSTSWRCIAQPRCMHNACAGFPRPHPPFRHKQKNVISRLQAGSLAHRPLLNKAYPDRYERTCPFCKWQRRHTGTRPGRVRVSWDAPSFHLYFHT